MRLPVLEFANLADSKWPNPAYIVNPRLFQWIRQRTHPFHDEVRMPDLDVSRAQIDSQRFRVTAIAEPRNAICQLRRRRFHHDLCDAPARAAF